MKKARYLLLRSSLLPGESLPSYLVRLAKLNGYHTPNMVVQLCQERLSQPDIITRPSRAETYARLADLVKLDDDWLFAASAHTFAITILPARTAPEFISLRSKGGVVLLPSAVLRQHLWLETDAQFCPHCLTEIIYHRLAWLPQAVSVCLAHRCLLVKGCPICGDRLKIGDIVEGHCGQCGFDLRTSPTISIAEDAFGLFSQQTIQSWLRIPTTNRVNQSKLPKQPDYVLYQAVYGLHRAIRTIQRRWDYLHDPFDVETAISVFPCEKKSEMTPFKSYLLYATAFKALLRWPYGFFEFLNAFTLRDEAEPTETVANDLGSIYTTWLMNTWKQPEFSFLQAVFEQYLQENFAFSLALQQKYRGSTDYSEAIGSDYITYHNAAQRLNTNVIIIERLVELGLLTNYSQSPRKSPVQRFKLVSRDAVSTLKQQWQYGIPLYDTARLLGVSQEVMKKMMKSGLIRAINDSEIDDYKVKIGSQSLAYFFRRLERGGVRYIYDQPVKTISLAKAVEAVAEDGWNVVFLIEQILVGALRGYWQPRYRNLGQLRVSVEDLRALRQAIRGDQPKPIDVEATTVSSELEGKSPEIRLTALQLAQQLGIERDQLWLWIRQEVVVLASELEIAESQN